MYNKPEQRIEQIRRIEKLHDEIEPSINYPIEFLHYRITRYRLDTQTDLLLVGSAVLPDLRLMIDELSRSVDMPVDEPVESEEELAKRLNVSTKTIFRWRRQGLRWRWVRPDTSGSRKLVMTRHAIDLFLARNAQRVERASRFSQMTPTARRRILERARHIAESREVTLNQVATHLARRTGRAVETIRLILEHHDEQHPDNRIFEDHTGPLTARQKLLIARAHRMGVRTGTMVRKFRRTRTTIYRVLREQRLENLRRVALNYVHLPIFERPDADAVLLRPLPEPSGPDDSGTRAISRLASLDELPVDLHAFFTGETIDPDRQLSLFVRFNYLKHKINRLRQTFDAREPRVAELDHVDAWLEELFSIRNRLASANQRHVLDAARRHLTSTADRSLSHLLTLIESAQPLLMDAIEVFDPSRNQTFESFLRWSLMRSYAGGHREGQARAHRRIDPPALLKRLEAVWETPTPPEPAPVP